MTENTDRPAEASDDEADVFHDARFPPEEEAALVKESHAQKSEANTLFSSARYSEAISIYDRAISSCPNYLGYEIAVLRSNVAACHLKLQEWKEAVDAATLSLECLERLDAQPEDSKESGSAGKSGGKGKQEPAPGEVVELDDDEEDAEKALAKLKLDDKRQEDIARIRAKSLLRRARARSELSGWGNLAGAEEDYKVLAAMDNLPPSDMKIVKAALRDLPPKINAAKDKEVGEMMGKLKDLGNGILKPFGLSTDNFKMVKDEKTGGYSMSFEQGK